MYPVLNDEPVIYQDIIWLWDAFLLLSGTRPMGFGGPTAIPLQEILAYSKIYAIEDHEELEEFTWTIRILDSEWLSEHYRRQDNKGKKK
jgi:hypothetical protein